jgi:DNA-nicking Smr family endonuclease
MPPRAKDWSGLSELRDALAREAQEREARDKALHAEQIRVRQQGNEFRDAVADVTPLTPSARIEHRRPLHPPLAQQRMEDDRQVLLESVSDEFEIDTLLQTDDALSFRRPGVGPDVLRKLRRGDWVTQAEIDLHGCRVDEAREVLANFLRHVIKRGFRCIRVVHGKGLGSKGGQPVLKGKVRVWLAQRDEVIAFCQARPTDGGSGALVVLLKPSDRP